MTRGTISATSTSPPSTLEDCLDLPAWIIDELIRELIDRPHELPVEPFPHAVPVLTRLARETPLLFVTARDRRRPIEHWLHRNLASVPPAAIRVLATGDPDTKIHYLKDHGIQYFVEDRLETCLQLADHGITPILFAQPWNRQPHPFPEVADWPELARAAVRGLGFREGARGRRPLPEWACGPFLHDCHEPRLMATPNPHK